MTQPAAAGLDRATAIALGVVVFVLVAGFVVLSALGRDTVGYTLLLGGPAVTAIVGAIVGRRVSAVQATVAAAQVETTAQVHDATVGLDAHLSAQDSTLRSIAAEVTGEPEPAAPPRVIPSSRTPTAPSPFGPVHTGLISREKDR